MKILSKTYSWKCQFVQEFSFMCSVFGLNFDSWVNDEVICGLIFTAFWSCWMYLYHPVANVVEVKRLCLSLICVFLIYDSWFFKLLGKALMVGMYYVMVWVFCVSDAIFGNVTIGKFFCIYCLSEKYFVCFASLQKHKKIPNSIYLILINS